MGLSANAKYLLEQRYCKPGETPEAVFKRTAECLADKDMKLEERLYDLMTNGIFLPNSPAIYNSGATKPSLHACYCLPIEDDIGSIFNTISAMARIFKDGGGVGINFSNLREKNAELSGGGSSSGTISFMTIFDNIVEVVKQGGYRRGALMGVLWYYHPEIFNFIKVKLEGKLQNFNLSIMVTDEFMQKVDDKENGVIDIISPKYGKIKEVRAKDIFDIMAFTSWVNGDPALLFYNRINQDNPFYPDKPIVTTNPCSEVGLPPYGACCLGSINISKLVWKNTFNFDRFHDMCQVATRVLINMNKISHYPLPAIKKEMEAHSPLGVGIMGFADCLIKLGINYDSQECLDFIDKIGKVYTEATRSIDPETFHFYRRIIAPTGSLSILADCSSGIEPIYDVAFQRNLVVGKIEETRDLYKSQYCRTAYQVSPEWHVKVLAQWQKYADGGVSKTVNMPNNASVEDIKEVYKLAWKMGVKGITVYRDGSREEQVLYSRPSTPPKVYMGKCSDGTCTL